MVFTSRYFPTCDWSYDTKYQFFTSTHGAIGAAVDFQSAPAVAVPSTPWPVNDTFQVVQALVTEEGVQCVQKSAAFVGLTATNGSRYFVALPRSVGVCVGGRTKWTSIQSISFPKPSVCTAPALRITVGRANGAAGTIYYPIVFTNVGAKACQLSGVPSVQPATGALAGVAHVAVGPLSSVSNRSASGYGNPVRLSRGDKASAALGVTETGNYTPSQCVAASFQSLDVSLQGSGNWWVPLKATTCTLLASTSVSGVVAGTSGLAP